MKKMLMTTVIASIFLLGAWVNADRHAIANIYLVTSFDFSRYPACASAASSYCVQAIRFYDPDAHTRLAEVLVAPSASGPQTITATIRVSSSMPRHAYAVTVYRTGSATLREGLPGQVSSFSEPSFSFGSAVESPSVTQAAP